MKIKREISALLLLVLLTVSCANFTMTKPTKDETVRSTLYALKQSWVEIRSYTMNNYLSDIITEQQLDEFKLLDDSFTLYYDLAVNVYLANQPNNDAELDSAIATLKELILKARKQVYSKEVN